MDVPLPVRAYMHGVMLGRLHCGKLSREYVPDGEDIILCDTSVVRAILNRDPEVVKAYEQGWKDGLA